MDPEASVRFASRAPAQLVDRVRWDGFYHEMFNEPDHEGVFRRMEAWLEARA